MGDNQNSIWQNFSISYTNKSTRIDMTAYINLNTVIQTSQCVYIQNVFIIQIKV